MAKYPTNPTLFNDALQLSISKLKEWDYLKPNKIINTTLDWSRGGNTRGSISIIVNTTSKPYFIELDYNYKDIPRKYKIDIVSVPSNLGKGNLFYFLCPQTKKRCRKLYSIGGYFFHRKAFNGCMYQCQTENKRSREFYKVLVPQNKIDNLYSEIHKKYFKKQYAGKPTKRYLRIKKQIDKAEKILLYDYEKLMLMLR